MTRKLFFAVVVVCLVASGSAYISYAQEEFASEIIWKPDGTQVAVGYWDGRLQIHDALTGDLVLSLVGHSNTIESIAWHPTDNLLISSSLINHETFLWNTTTGQLVADLYSEYGFPPSIRKIMWTVSGDQILVSSQGGQPYLQIWDAQTFQYVFGRYDFAPIYENAVSPDETLIAF